MDPRNSVMAFYVGGPLNDTREVVPLINDRPPLERRCAQPAPPIGVAIPDATDEDLKPPPVGVYWFRGGTQAPDYEGLPGDKRWVEATYEWRGWLG